MSDGIRKIKWQGQELILVTSVYGPNEGAITTPERFNQMALSLAHLGRDGIIRQFHKNVGTIDDIEFLDGKNPSSSAAGAAGTK